MPNIIPAILTREADEAVEKLKFLEAIPDIAEVQIDFEDGQFVENTTVLPKGLPPLATRLSLEAHLMVKNPESYFHDLEELGFKVVIIHYESFKSEQELASAASNARSMGFTCGVAINPQTEVGVFDKFINQIDLCLLMSVYPGFQGKPFLPESLGRIQILRERHKDAIIEVDGGINLDNFMSVAAYGANRIVVGSGIWQTPDAKQTIHSFFQKLK